MMLVVKIVSFISLLIFGIPDATIKKAKEDFANVNKAFTVEKLSVEMTYKFYEYEDAEIPIETKTGLFYKKGSKDFSKVMNIETLHTEDLTITVQTEDKLLVVAGPISKRSALSISPDTLLRICKSIVSEKLPGNLIKYELTFPDNTEIAFKKLEMIYDASTYRISKFIMRFKEQDKVNEDGTTQRITPKVEISYKNYNKVSVDGLSVFDSSNYILKVSENKYKTTGKYSSYKIYNQKIN